MNEFTRVLVADDREILRAGIKQFIDDQPDMRVTAEAGTGDEVIQLVRSGTFDILLLDIAMPRKNGMDCLKVIKQLNEALPVLIVSDFPEQQYAKNMLRLGADGYFQKSDTPVELIRAIRKVASGHRYLSRNMTELLVDELASSTAKARHEMLSAREYQIFYKLAGGVPTKEIGMELNLSPKTISTYRARVLTKLQLKTNADLSRYAFSVGLLA